MNICSTSTQEDYIMTALDEIAPMIRRYAHAYGFDADDLQQECALHMWQARIPAEADPIAYLYGVARNQLNWTLARSQKTVSLDETRGESEWTLYDLMPEQKSKKQESKFKEALYSVLREMPLEDQLFARDSLQLADFRPLVTNWREPSPFSRNYRRETPQTLKDRIGRFIRSHPFMRSLIQQETRVL